MKKVTNMKTNMNIGTGNAILTRIWWRYKIHHDNWSWRNRSIERRSTNVNHALMEKTIQDQLCLYPKTIDSKCWREGILDLLWRTWRCAEKQEPCSRLVTYESDQASGVRTLIVSSCQWYDFKCSRIVEEQNEDWLKTSTWIKGCVECILSKWKNWRFWYFYMLWK